MVSRQIVIVLVVLLVLLALAVGGGSVWLLVGAPHLLAQPIADALPREWEPELGDQSLTKNGWYMPPCKGAGGQAALAALLAKLGEGLDPPLDAVVWITPRKPLAAYAGPGNRLLLTDGLLQRIASPDQLAALVAHLLGHSQARHPTAWMVRVLGHDGVLTYLGENLAAMRKAVETKTEIARFIPYTEDQDEAAEAWARRRLAAAGIAPGGLYPLFAALQRGNRVRQPEIEVLVRQHPLPEQDDDREAQADARPALTGPQWTQLKAICR